jgi:histidinol-phosphate aminotransferase
LLNSNENPYGPSAKALAALVAANPVASRYPDDAEDAMRAAIAKHHGVAPEQVVLGCGSSEILQMADLPSQALAGEPSPRSRRSRRFSDSRRCSAPSR